MSLYHHVVGADLSHPFRLTLSVRPRAPGATLLDTPEVPYSGYAYAPSPFLDPAAGHLQKSAAQLGPVALPVQHREQKVLTALVLMAEL